MIALLAGAAQLHSISNIIPEGSSRHAYLLILARLSDGQLHRCMRRARERARPQTRLVLMHIPMLVIGCSGKFWQGRGRLRIQIISSSTWRVHVRCIVDGSGVCAPPLTAAAVWSHRLAASAAAQLHRRLCRQANADDSLLMRLAFCECDVRVRRGKRQNCNSAAHGRRAMSRPTPTSTV